MLCAEVNQSRGVYPKRMTYLRRLTNPGVSPENVAFEYVVQVGEGQPPATMQVAAAGMYAHLAPMVDAVRRQLFPEGELVPWTDQTGFQIVQHFRGGA